jgi:hypothetical protein
MHCCIALSGIDLSIGCVLFPESGATTIEEEDQNMDMVAAVLWLIAGASFALVVLGCWMTKPAAA